MRKNRCTSMNFREWIQSRIHYGAFDIYACIHTYTTHIRWVLINIYIFLLFFCYRNGLVLFTVAHCLLNLPIPANIFCFLASSKRLQCAHTYKQFIPTFGFYVNVCEGELKLAPSTQAVVNANWIVEQLSMSVGLSVFSFATNLSSYRVDRKTMCVLDGARE